MENQVRTFIVTTVGFLMVVGIAAFLWMKKSPPAEDCEVNEMSLRTTCEPKEDR